MIKRFIYTIFSVCLIFAITGCGGNSGSEAPEGTTITISGTESRVNGHADMTATEDELRIIVKNADGIPLNNVKLRISFGFARSAVRPLIYDAATNTGGYRVLFFDDGSETNSPMEVTTDKYGVYTLVFRYWSGNSVAYTGDFVVSSGTSTATHEFAVTAS